MAAEHPSAMSAGTRRLLVDYIVYRHLGSNYPVWWGEERSSPVAIAYRAWALEVTPSMRAALETMTSDALQTAYDECNDYPGWQNFSLWLNELQDHQEEIERQRQYHLSLSKRGGHAHPSRWQPEIVSACQDMYTRNSKISSKKAYEKLKNGYVMPDGEVVTFRPLIEPGSFQRRYWPKRRPKCDSYR